MARGPILLATADDRYYQARQEIELEFQGACVDCKTDVSADYRVAKSWRGWVVGCDDCKAVVAELDD